MIPLSVLDLSPIVEGGDAGQSLQNSLDLARNAERLGYQRYWVAEHHNLQGVASAATAVVIAHLGAGTRTIRIGAGGIMLPNHAPLVIAEQFGTLEALYPGRVDLGLGRAPGTDPVTARALRRTLMSDVDYFPQDVLELMAYFKPAQPGQQVKAIPGAGLNVPVWILGSSLYGAQLAAALGLPYAFASHFAPEMMEAAIQVYRSQFQPSEYLDKPYVMLGVVVVAADSDERATFLLSSIQQSFLNRQHGRPSLLPPPIADMDDRLDASARAGLAQRLRCSVIGGPDTVREGLRAFIARTGADELMVATQIWDHAERVHSFEVLAAARDALAAETPQTAGAVL